MVQYIKKELVVMPKLACGTKRYYPSCETSKTITSIIKQRNGSFCVTLTQEQIEKFKKDGWEIIENA